MISPVQPSGDRGQVGFGTLFQGHHEQGCAQAQQWISHLAGLTVYQDGPLDVAGVASDLLAVPFQGVILTGKVISLGEGVPDVSVLGRQP